MAEDFRVLVLPGDGVGPEVVQQTKRVAEWLGKHRALSVTFEDGLIGGAALDAYGTPLHGDTLARAQDVDAVLLGAVGGPRWDKVAFDKRPEAGLLSLRRELDLFANLRPALVFDALADSSPLKPELVQGLDLLIVRELTGGVYFGEPRGITDLGGGKRRGVNTQVYSSDEIRRVAQVAFELARQRDRRVTSVDKANVMESGMLWREEVSGLHDEGFTDIALDHMYADNCAMQLAREPGQFDVVVTDNLFGDMLSDEAAMLTGSLGMLPSASLGAADSSGRRRALYEPVHGSAPDLAGKNAANPLATLLSFAMMLRYSFARSDLARLVEQAVQNVLNKGTRTADIMAPGMAKVSTGVMGDSILRQLDHLDGR